MEFSRKVVAVDFDGTIVSGHEEVGKPAGSIMDLFPVQGVVDAVRAAHEAGHFVVVYTARPWVEKANIQWVMDAHCIPYDIIECGKIRYDVQLDDKTHRTTVEGVKAFRKELGIE